MSAASSWTMVQFNVMEGHLSFSLGFLATTAAILYLMLIVVLWRTTKREHLMLGHSILTQVLLTSYFVNTLMYAIVWLSNGITQGWTMTEDQCVKLGATNFFLVQISFYTIVVMALERASKFKIQSGGGQFRWKLYLVASFCVAACLAYIPLVFYGRDVQVQMYGMNYQNLMASFLLFDHVLMYKYI